MVIIELETQHKVSHVEQNRAVIKHTERLVIWKISKKEGKELIEFL